jgi:hypothetical protein
MNNERKQVESSGLSEKVFHHKDRSLDYDTSCTSKHWHIPSLELRRELIPILKRFGWEKRFALEVAQTRSAGM